MARIIAKNVIAMKDIPYKSVVESFMHVMVRTRPNLAYWMSHSFQFMNINFRKEHWVVTQKVLQHIKNTLTLALALFIFIFQQCHL